MNTYYKTLINSMDYTAFPLRNTLKHLIDATRLLLDRGYDGEKHEEYLYCIRNLEECMKKANKELDE